MRQRGRYGVLVHQEHVDFVGLSLTPALRFKKGGSMLV